MRSKVLAAVLVAIIGPATAVPPNLFPRQYYGVSQAPAASSTTASSSTATAPSLPLNPGLSTPAPSAPGAAPSVPVAGPSAPGPSAPGAAPSAPGVAPSVPGPSAPGAASSTPVAGPSAPGPSTPGAGPSAPGPSAPGAVSSAPGVAPSVPGPSAPGAASSTPGVGPSAPGPSNPGPSSPTASSPTASSPATSPTTNSPTTTSPTTTTPTTTSPTTTSPTSSPTWTIQVEVGQTGFDIGLADDTTFQAMWAKACGPNGCDGGSPQSFNYYTTSGNGAQVQYSASFTITGNVDNNQGWTNTLLDSINAVMLPAKNCTTTPIPCVKKRLNPGGACTTPDVTNCYLPNYYQATMYDPNHDQMAQITVSAQDKTSGPFDCSTVLGTLNAGLTAVKIAPPVAGAAAFASVICLALTS